MTLVQTEPKKIYYGECINDMQGPCPTGFHVPTKDEWTTVYNILDGLDASYMRTVSYIKTYLKLPPNGYLTPDIARSYELGTSCWYWSCEKNGNYNGYIAYCDNGHPFNVSSMSSGYGCSIRPFKDGVVNPISSGSTLKSGWTWLYHSGSNNYGIAHNSSDGIISLSSDGTTWITMADKNVGATTVYNNGDSQTEDNCGKAYQRGNNYGSPITGGSGAISGPVDASAYGPGNYYSSGFVITNSSAGYNWDSSYNKNLRGGVSQGNGAKEVKKVYLGNNLVYEATITPTTVTVTDSTNVVANSTTRTSGYYYGIKFTALKTGKITKVAFLYNGTHSATLKIAQGAYASVSGTTYNYTADASGEYELPTPYDITEGVSYVVSINTGNYNYFSYRSTGSYPITGTAVRYDYSTYSGSSAQYTNATYAIKSLTIEYTP